MIVYFDFIDSDRKKKLGRWIGQVQNITSNEPVGKFVQMAFPYGRTPYLCMIYSQVRTNYRYCFYYLTLTVCFP